MIWTCLLFNRYGKNHIPRHNERGKTIRQTEEDMEDNIRDWTGLEFGKSQRAVENRGKNMEKTGCEVICVAATTIAVKGLMIIMMTSYCLSFNWLITAIKD